MVCKTINENKVTVDLQTDLLTGQKQYVSPKLWGDIMIHKNKIIMNKHCH